MSNSVLSLVSLFFVLYLLLAVTLFFSQSRLIYYPDPVISATPQKRGLAYEDVIFTATDGVRLAGWLIPAKESKGTILFCHGNAGNISHRLETIALLNQLGYSTFIFDYRGYGKSEGAPSEEGTYLDVEGAWEYLVNHQKTSPDHIIPFGRSLGGAIAAWISTTRQPKACILESSFTSAPDIAASLYSFFPTKIICRFQYDALAAVKKITCPLLIVHSVDDDIIPFSHGEKLFLAAAEPKTFLKIYGDHNGGFLQSGSLYKSGLENFLKTL